MYLNFVKHLATTLLSFFFATGLLQAKELPLLPSQGYLPFDPAHAIKLTDSKALNTLFLQQGYTKDLLATKDAIPPLLVINLPKDLNQQPVNEKVSLFIRLLLPNVLAVNAQITKVRNEVVQLKSKATPSLSAAEQDWLKALLAHYSINTEVNQSNLAQLLLQLDTYPVGMVMAQGIDESGWGTSYFALAGNALYGQHNPRGRKQFLTARNADVKVAAFDSLFQSTAGYMYNLNTGRAYKDLRELRAQLRRDNKLTGYALIEGLVNYSSRGSAYIDDLRQLISQHELDSLNDKELKQEAVKAIKFRP